MAAPLPNIPYSPGPEMVCSNCGVTMPLISAFCPGCGESMRELPVADRLAASFSYFTFIPAAVFLLLPGFRNRRFVRFHAWQSVLMWGAYLVLSAAALFLSNISAAMFFLIAGILASLAVFFAWIVLAIKSWQGERFDLPLFGAFAERLR